MVKKLPILSAEPETGGGCSAELAWKLSTGREKSPETDFRGRAALITLGCAKNQVDSEVMLGLLQNEGYEIVSDLAQADVAVVNTCGFLESAVQEGIDCILNVSDYKETGRLRKLIVAGCMVSRYGDELKSSLPEVDVFLKVDETPAVALAAGTETDSSVFAAAARPYFLYDDTMPRHLSTLAHTAYVKISDGCNRPCTFCIIPKIRGSLRSREFDSVLREIDDLGARGVREVNLLAQDLTAYGSDLKGGGGGLAELLRAIDARRAVDWVRLLYAYPLGVDSELLDAVAELPSVCSYLDLPLQHSAESVLKRMQRPLGKFAPRPLVRFIKERQPGLSLRTTFIVGFPGETEGDLADLESFIREGWFDSLGVFEYSQEAGTPAAELPDQVPTAEGTERRARLMLAQREVVAAKLEAYVGRTLDVLVEGRHEETDLLLSGRTRFQAPEVDGQVLINDLETVDEVLPIGTIAPVKITEVAGYDLVGCLRSLT